MHILQQDQIENAKACSADDANSSCAMPKIKFKRTEDCISRILYRFSPFNPFLSSHPFPLNSYILLPLSSNCMQGPSVTSPLQFSTFRSPFIQNKLCKCGKMFSRTKMNFNSPSVPSCMHTILPYPPTQQIEQEQPVSSESLEGEYLKKHSIRSREKRGGEILGGGIFNRAL